MSLKQLFEIDKDMIKTLKILAVILVLVIIVAIPSFSLISNGHPVLGIVVAIFGAVVIAIGSINYIKHNS